MVTVRTFTIHSPSSDQAMAVARLLKSVPAPVRVLAIESVQRRRRLPKYYDGWIEPGQVKDSHTQVVATAGDTEAALSVGDVDMGSVTMSKACLRVFDKVAFLGIALGAGVPVPETVDLTEFAAKPFYPAFYKEALEVGGGRRGFIADRSDLPVDQAGLIAQEFIASSETYGVAFVASNGRVRFSVAHCERFSYPRVGGSAVIIEREESPRLEELTRRLVAELEYSGWGLAEFKYCPKRRDYVAMEINAKLWASCEFSFRHCPEMFAELFGMPHRASAFDRVIYLNRLLALGPGGLLRPALYAVRRRGTVIRYPRTWVALLSPGRRMLDRMLVRVRSFRNPAP